MTTTLTDPIFSTTIQTCILDYLQDWKLDTDNTLVDGLQLSSNNTISTGEVERFYVKSLQSCKNYMCRDVVPDDARVLEAVCKYAAGLLYKKYNIRANDNHEDEQVQVGYGDSLLINARNDLNPFRTSTINIW